MPSTERRFPASSRLPVEIRALFLASAPDPERTGEALDRLVDVGLDWRRLGRLAERERVLPVLWDAVARFERRMPPEVASDLRRAASVSEFWTGRLRSSLERSLRALEAGDRVMLLKGAALGCSAYGSFAERPMGDLDLLVRSEESGAAWGRLRGAGWTPTVRGADEFYRRHHHLRPLMDPAGPAGPSVEVHRSLLAPSAPFLLDEQALWDRSRVIEVGRQVARVPSDVHLLLHACVHFAWSNAMAGGLTRTVRDVAVLSCSASFDWDGFLGAARGARVSSCCYWPLRLARDLVAAHVPDRVLDALRPGGLPRPVLEALGGVYVVGALMGYPWEVARRLLWKVGIRPVTSGLGAARPWDDTRRWSKGMAGERSDEGSRDGLRDVTAWLGMAGRAALPSTPGYRPSSPAGLGGPARG